MSKFSKIAMISGLVAAVIASTAAFAVSKRTWSAGARDVQNLIRLMDQDKNGVVSKEEFMQFMEAEFDRLDVDKSGGLPPRSSRIPASTRARTQILIVEDAAFFAPRDRYECRAARNARDAAGDARGPALSRVARELRGAGV